MPNTDKYSAPIPHLAVSDGEVPDADAAWQQAVKAGATKIMALANQFWGMRYGEVKDPFGHIWGIGGPVT